MPLEQVTEQFALLNEFRLSLPRGRFRTSCELAEIELEQYKATFVQKYEREAARVRAV